MNAVTTQIASLFNVITEKVTKVEEWAHVWFAVVKGVGARFVSKKKIQIQKVEKKMPRLLGNNNPIMKPQNNISSALKAQIITETKTWLESFGLPPSVLHMLAEELYDRAYNARIDGTSASAPSVMLSDNAKRESLVLAIQKIAYALDDKGELDDVIEGLVAQAEHQNEW